MGKSIGGEWWRECEALDKAGLMLSHEFPRDKVENDQLSKLLKPFQSAQVLPFS